MLAHYTSSIINKKITNCRIPASLSGCHINYMAGAGTGSVDGGPALPSTLKIGR